MERVRAALNRARRDDLVDVGLAVLMMVLAIYGTLAGNYDGPSPGPVLAWDVLLILPLAVRRRFPVAVWCTVLGLVVAEASVLGSNDSMGIFFGLLVGCYTVAAYRPRRIAVWCLVALAPVIALTNWISTGRPLEDLEFIVVLIGGFWVAGRVVWSRDQLVRQLAEQSEELRRGRDAGARAQAAELRERIARDVHDVVAHSVSLMVVQAEAGEAQLPDKAPSAECLRTIQRVGRDTLTELRGLLATMGEAAGTDPESPATSSRLRDADLLAEELGRAGLTVEMRVEGDLDGLTPGIDLAAYRILQEALTNALRHASAREVRARVAVDSQQLVVEVVDHGGGTAGVVGNGVLSGGRGLAGMRERARLYGGDVESGRTADGFRVRARIPVPSAPTVRP